MGPIDGTVVPSAAGGSLPFLPAATLRVLKTIRNRYPSAWSKYGFVNAFNPLKNWYDSDVIGIDTGIILLMAENLRTGFVWETFMKTAEAKRGMERAGFHKYKRSNTGENRKICASSLRFLIRPTATVVLFIQPPFDTGPGLPGVDSATHRSTRQHFD